MNGIKTFFLSAALRAMFGMACIASTSHAQTWLSGPLAGKEGRVATSFNVYGAMRFHDRHDLRPFPSYIFKEVQSMTVQVEAGAEEGTPEIRNIELLIRNARSDHLGHWPSATPEQVSLVVAGRQASFVLDPARLVADLGAFVEYGMTKVYVRIDYDLPPYEVGDWIEVAFVMVPPYRASLSSLSETLSVTMGRVVDLKPSSNPYYGVSPEEVPASGYMVEPVSDDFFFDPPALSSDSGVVTLPYAAPAGTFSAAEERKTGEASIDIPGASRPIQHVNLLKAYAKVQYVAGDVRIKQGLSPDYIPAAQDMLVQPHDTIRMTVRPQQGGGLIRPSLGLQFYDGMNANLEVTGSFDLVDKDVVISFDEQGVVSQRHRNFVTDLSDFAYTVGENRREYMRIGIKKTLGFLAGKVTGGFGWVASKTAEKTMEYGIDKISDYNRPSSRLQQSASAPGYVDPSGVERVMELEWVLRADGSVLVENNGGTVDVVAERGSTGGTRMGPFSRIQVDPRRESLSQAAQRAFNDALPAPTFAFSPGPGAVTGSALPRIEVAIPFPGNVYVHPRSLECRLNGKLISPWMHYRYDGATYRHLAVYPVPINDPLADGVQHLEVAVVREDGRRFETQSTFIVESTPAPPVDLRILNGRDRLALRWRPAAESYVTGYQIFRSAAEGTPGTWIAEVAHAVFVDDTAAPGVTYWYTVQATGAGRTGDLSGPVSGRRDPSASQDPPAAPATLGATGHPNRVVLSFDDDAWNAAGWRVERALSAAGTFSLVPGMERIAGSGVADASVTNGITYYYRLIPEGIDGQVGTAVASSGVTPGPRPATAPTGLSVHRLDDTFVRLRWDPPFEADSLVGYRIEASRDGGSWTTATNVPPAATGCDWPAPASGVYGFQMIALEAGGAESAPGGIALVSMLSMTPRAYVDPASPDPQPPYASWETAARDLQSAIDAADDGHEILVASGIYNTGGRAVFGAMTNRVVVDRKVAVRSINGPGSTVIEGALDPDLGSWGDLAIRAAYLGEGAVLDGFTVRHGATRGWGDKFDPGHEQSGGGIWSEGGAEIRNCVVVSNFARYGGGIYNAQPVSGMGGVFNSRIEFNRAMDDGGGLLLSTAYNSLIRNNEAWTGGGGFSVYLYNCTVTANTGYQRGGMAGGTAWNTILHGNSDNEDTPNWGGGNMGVNIHYSCTEPLPPGGNPGNITGPPVFVNAVGGDYRLAPGSPGIDAGTNQTWMGGAVDLSGTSRIRFGRVDMGCYESPVMADADDDGIPDWWEVRYFGGPTAAVATQLAANQINTLREAYAAGLAPHDPDAMFEARVAQPSVGGIEIRWPSAAGRVYRIDRSTNLVAPNGGFALWLEDITATPPENVHQDSMPVGEASGTYRVLVRPE